MKQKNETIAVVSLSGDIFMATFASVKPSRHGEGNYTRYEIQLTPDEQVAAENILEAYKQTVFALEQLLLMKNLELGGLAENGRPYVERPLALAVGAGAFPDEARVRGIQG